MYFYNNSYFSHADCLIFMNNKRTETFAERMPNFIVIFLDFQSTKHGLSLVDSSSPGLDENQMYPNRDTSRNVPCSGYITARDQSMVEGGVTEGGKNTASFLFREWTQQHKHEASN